MVSPVLHRLGRHVWRVLAVLCAAVLALAVARPSFAVDGNGNDGDIKVASSGSEPGSSNDPHVTCPIDVIWAGFGTSSPHLFDVKMTAQSPSSGTVGIVSGATTGTFTTDGQKITYYLDLSDFENTNGATDEYHISLDIKTTTANSVNDKQKTVWVAPCTSEIEIEKVWQHSDGSAYDGATPAGGPFVTATYDNGTAKTSDDVTAHEGETLKVPYGESYTVAENVPANWDNASGLGTFTAPTTPTGTHTVVNRLETRDVAIVKEWRDVNGEDAAAPATDVVTATNERTGEQAHEGDTLTVDHGDTVTVAEPATTEGWHYVSGAGSFPITADTTLTVVNEKDEVVVPEPTGDLELAKAVVDDNGEAARFGDTLTYTLTASATGDLDQTGVVVTDEVPAGTTYVADSAACSPACDGAVEYDAGTGTVTWNVGELAAGDESALTFKVRIDTPVADEDGGIPGVTITNVGLAESDQDATESNEVVTNVTAVLGVKVIKPPAGNPQGGNPPAAVPPAANPPAAAPEALPFTGAPILGLTGLAGLLLVAGTALCVLALRRRGEPA